MTEKKGGISADLKPGVTPPTEPPPKPADHGGDLLARAQRDRADREATHEDYRASWDQRESAETAERAESFLGVPVDRDSMVKMSDGRERTCWRFEADGKLWLAGVYWERVPGPAGNTFFIALQIWQRPGKVDWPPPDEHGREWCPKGYHRLHVLADLVEAVEARQSIDDYIATENKPAPEERWPIDDHGPRRGPQHWDWRCMECGEPASRHAPWIVRLWRRWRS